MSDGSDSDRLLSARIFAISRRLAFASPAGDMDAAVAELREAAGHRPELLAEQAGLFLGFARAGLDLLAEQYRARAWLCIAAGADKSLIGPWIEIGAARAAAARQVPYSGGI